ncbi:MAG: hypothetical protein LBM38_05965 [Clostridiales bacterium]|nr:hypothetical protein [Clostridiales bacterium]
MAFRVKSVIKHQDSVVSALDSIAAKTWKKTLGWRALGTAIVSGQGMGALAAVGMVVNIILDSYPMSQVITPALYTCIGGFSAAMITLAGTGSRPIRALDLALNLKRCIRAFKKDLPEDLELAKFRASEIIEELFKASNDPEKVSEKYKRNVLPAGFMEQSLRKIDNARTVSDEKIDVTNYVVPKINSIEAELNGVKSGKELKPLRKFFKNVKTKPKQDFKVKPKKLLFKTQ